MAQRITQADKVQCAIRHSLMGTSVPALKRRYGVHESTIKGWIRKYRAGQLIKRHSQWDPNWDHEDVIYHPLDPDIVNAINRGEPSYENSIIGIMPKSNDFDGINGIGPIIWSDKDIDKLIRSVFDRSLEILRDSGIHTEEFKEELKFVDSKFFFMICKAYGYDCDEVRKGVYRFVAERCAREEDQ